MQTWWENNYNTRLLHHKLAFPLLKKLTDAGDTLARTVFKEEIAKRYEHGNKNIQEFLKLEGYLSYLSKEEINSLKY